MKIAPDAACNYGCIVSDPQSHEVLHYVEKPSSYISSTINCGVYLFDTSLFAFIRKVMNKVLSLKTNLMNSESKKKQVL
jgi:mannose-1-phosphate guanylyltransferase